MCTTIKNSRVIVTGAATGIGNEYAHQLLLKGAKIVAILDVNETIGNEATEKLNTQFGSDRAVFFLTDVSKSDKFEASFKKAIDHLGGLDIMINNAGILDDSKWSLMIDINIKGLIQGTLMAVDVMGKHKGGKGGTVINIGSTAAFVEGQYSSVYCATKHAVVGFSRGVALNYEQTGVAVKTMCPGPTNTFLMNNKDLRFLDFVDREEGRQCLQSWAQQKPEIIAKTVIRLIEEAPNSAIWVNTVESSTLSLNIPQFTEWGTSV